MNDQEPNDEQRPDERAAAADAVLGESPEQPSLAAAEIDEGEQARRDLELARDRLLRAQAELDNYRKRARRELEDERRYAALPLLGELLPVIDNIGRAIQAAEKNSEAGSLIEGVKMIAQQLEGVLGRQHCVRIDALHKPFDPHLHQAIMQQPSADHPPGTVLHVAQEGYQVHDRVLRPSQVIVSTAPSEESAGN